MKRLHSLTGILLVVAVIFAISACNLLPFGKGKGGQQGAGGGASQQQSNVNLTGDWEVAFLFGDQTMKSTMRLQQQGQDFAGEGADEQTGRQFAVEHGSLNGEQVFFKKRYPGTDPNFPPVEYAGAVKMINDKDYQGPYMQGEYTALVNGQPTSGQWEAQLLQQQAPPNTAGAPEAPPPPEGSDRAPHLSGKWDVGYEYNFKTIKSTLYLEQDGGKLIGHGVDTNTKEKFTVEKGWYHFPKVTLIRRYQKGKGAAEDREINFKATVEMVRDKDYQGPYMSGKTQGGGAWEAQLVK